MVTFAKAQAASFIASAIDYIITILCVELFGFPYYAASGTGTVAGGFVNFSVSREWVFKSRDKHRNIQLLQYAMVWTGYLIITTSAVFLFTHYGKVNYIFSKVVVTLVMAIVYNYPLQRRFVFKKTTTRQKNTL